jgi:hypothetical protein
MTFEDVRAIALELPGVSEASARGVHSFMVRRTLFLRLLADGETLLLRTDRFERDHLLTTASGVFFVTPQIREHPWVFARLRDADPPQLRELIQDAWRRTAPRTLVDAFDART